MDIIHDVSVHDDFLRSGCWALALLGGKEDIPFLIKLLEPEPKHDRYVRGAAAIAIGLLGDRETLGELVTLAKESEHGSVRALAIAAIGWLADKDPVPRLPRLFHGLYDRQATAPIREAWSLL
jgi:HEAT repeat protein